MNEKKSIETKKGTNKEVVKTSNGIHTEAGRPWFNLCAIDSGFGFQKIDVKDASSKDSEHIYFNIESTLAPLSAYNKTLLDDPITINGVQYVIKSGKRVGERTDNGASTKNNIYTIANIHYALYQAYKRTGRESFKLGVGVTTDIYDDKFEREDYRSAILGDNNGEITIKCFEDEKEVSTTLKIEHLSIYPEGVSALYREKKLLERSEKQRVWISDIGTRTNHIISVFEGNHDTKTNPYMNGYVSLMFRIERALTKATGKPSSFRDADKEFKLYIKGAPQDVTNKKCVEKGLDQYLQLLVEDFENIGVDFANDAFYFIGGTSARIKPYITEYLQKEKGVDAKNILFSNNCFYANCIGMYSSLISTLRAEKAKQRKVEDTELKKAQ